MNYSRTDDGSSTLFKVGGELDALTSPELRPVLDGLASGSAERDVTVDLSELRLIDSMGVGALIALYKQVRANGGAVRFIGVAAQPRVIFEVLGLDLVFGLQRSA
jgi:anti-sigma B factor antagonist